MPKLTLRWLWLLLGFWLLLTLMRSFVLVNSGERAVIFNRLTGTQPVQLGEGLHWVMPWLQMPTVYDVKQETYTMSSSESERNDQAGNASDGLTALTADGLPVTLDISLRFHVDPDFVAELHRTVGPSSTYDSDKRLAVVEKLVRPEAHAGVRMVVAQYPVIDIYGPRRARLGEEINTRLRQALGANHIILDDALIRDVTFSPQFQQAIEQKQVAMQDVQRMTYELLRADKERRRKIIEAEGDAASISLTANALAKNPQLIQWEYVKNLPENVRTVVTDGRTIVNLGNSPLSTATVAAATDNSRNAAGNAASDQNSDNAGDETSAGSNP